MYVFALWQLSANRVIEGMNNSFYEMWLNYSQISNLVDIYYYCLIPLFYACWTNEGEGVGNT